MIQCKACQSTEYTTVETGPHLKAICAQCGKYIQFLPRGMDENSLMYYGKHAGKKIKDIPPEYLVWMYENGKTNGSLKLFIKANLSKLKSQINEAK